MEGRRRIAVLPMLEFNRELFSNGKHASEFATDGCCWLTVAASLMD
jgi:hypothetical protein